MSWQRDIDEVKLELRDHRKMLFQIRSDIAALKVKSGIWGAIAGIVTAGLLFLGAMWTK